jgi:hypothetical protein
LFGQEKGPRLLLLRGTSGGHGCQCEAEDNHSGSRDRTFSEAVNHFPRPADISKFSREGKLHAICERSEPSRFKTAQYKDVQLMLLPPEGVGDGLLRNLLIG